MVLPYINMNPPQVYSAPHPEFPSLLPLCTIPLGRLSTPAPSIQYHEWNLYARQQETQMYRNLGFLKTYFSDINIKNEYEHIVEKDIATLSSILAWRIPMHREAWQATGLGVVKNQT